MYGLSILVFTSRPKIRNFSWITSSALLLLLFPCTASKAQQVNFGRGPSLNNLNTSIQSQQFGLETGVSCPVTTFNVVSFFGRATDNAQTSTFNASSNSSLNNFGIAAGFSVPIGGRYSAYCKDYTEIKTEDARKRLEIYNTKFQSDLVQQCHYLHTLHIDFKDDAFNKDGPASALFPCREIVKSIRSAPVPTSSERLDPPSSSDSPSSSEKPASITKQEPSPKTQKSVVSYPPPLTTTDVQPVQTTPSSKAEPEVSVPPPLTPRAQPVIVIP